MHVRAAVRVASVREPWFRERPELTVAVAGLSYVAVFVLRLTAGTPQDGYSMLYVLPIALLATTFGLRAGVAAGLLAVGLMIIWSLLDDVSLAPMGWVSRIVPLLLLGILVGDASDRLRQAEEERVQMAAAARLQREAIEINDSLVQGMVAAKWAMEAGRPDTGLATLDSTIVQGHELVSGLIREAGMGPRSLHSSSEV